MGDDGALAREASAQRQVIAVGGNRCVVWGGAGVLERLGNDLKTAVGKPRLAMLLCQEGVPQLLAQELRRGLVSAGFRVRESAMTLGEEALTLKAASVLAKELAEAGLTADDALVVVGDTQALSLASWLGSQWCGGVVTAAIPTTLEALILVPGTPLDLGVLGLSELLHSGPGLSLVFGDPEVLALRDGGEGVLCARAVMVQTAFVESAKAFETLGARSQELAHGSDDVLVLTQALETTRARGRMISSNQAAVRRALSYGRPVSEALFDVVGKRAPASVLVAEGLRFTARLAWQVAGLDPELVFAQDALLERLGLGVLAFEGSAQELLKAYKAVLARRSNRTFLALPEALGRTRPRSVEDAVLLSHFEAFCKSRGSLA